MCSAGSAGGQAATGSASPDLSATGFNPANAAATTGGGIAPGFTQAVDPNSANTAARTGGGIAPNLAVLSSMATAPPVPAGGGGGGAGAGGGFSDAMTGINAASDAASLASTGADLAGLGADVGLGTGLGAIGGGMAVWDIAKLLDFGGTGGNLMDLFGLGESAKPKGYSKMVTQERAGEASQSEKLQAALKALIGQYDSSAGGMTDPSQMRDMASRLLATSYGNVGGALEPGFAQNPSLTGPMTTARNDAMSLEKRLLNMGQPGMNFSGDPSAFVQPGNADQQYMIDPATGAQTVRPGWTPDYGNVSAGAPPDAGRGWNGTMSQAYSDWLGRALLGLKGGGGLTAPPVQNPGAGTQGPPGLTAPWTPLQNNLGVLASLRNPNPVSP